MRSLRLIWVLVIAGTLVVRSDGVSIDAQTSDISAQTRAPVTRNARGKGTAQTRDPVLIAAGDIATCSSGGDEATAELIRGINGTVAPLGDEAYPHGSGREFARCYDPTWGTEKLRTRPAIGNHEYKTRNAKGYFDYFGAAAGDRGKGYYSYELGAWHIIVLNSNCSKIGGCAADSPQGRWLREDLAKHPATCTLAYWHHPLFSSGNTHGGDQAMRPAWDALYDAGADVVLSAHEHNYERFAPQDSAGKGDQRRGIREFVVGSGGSEHYGFGHPLPTSIVRNADTSGVLVLTLHQTSFDWMFVPVDSRLRPAGDTVFTDVGSADCHK